MNEAGCVREALVEGVHVLRIEGAVRYTIAPVVERFLDHLFTRASVGAVLVDLTSASFLDSTMLGVVARIAGRMSEQHQARPTIACPPGDILTLLRSMGFDEVFAVVSSAPDGADALPVVANEPVGGSPEARELARTVLQAHRTLAAMNPKNEATFHDVVEMMTREVDEKM
ncbi:MAG: anti-sigma factor antagonist [Deltaproteobacteria bacterium]|nr:MAG: anti-sigma factor antagonist [Deltaproteobacteria bacterium]